MPFYIFESPTGEQKEIFFHMKDEPKEYAENGIPWKRIFLPTLGSVDTKWDANNPRDFVEKSAKKHGTLGDIMDKSKELSEKRESKEGVDKVKQQMYKDYSKIRHGKQHPQDRKEKLEKVLKEPITLKIK